MDGQRQVVSTSAQEWAQFFCWANTFLMAIAVMLIGVLILFLDFHNDCDKPFFWGFCGNVAFLFIIFLLGIVGTRRNMSILLWIYLILLGSICIEVLVLFVIGLIIITHKSGHHVDGLRFKEYQLQDYSPWIIKQINNSHSWEHYKKCYVKLNCSQISELYKTREEYQLARLNPKEAGCCRPPSGCGYPTIDASYYNLSILPTSSHKDCKLYKNSNDVKCFNCDSCKAGVAQSFKREWTYVITSIVDMLVILPLMLWLGCRVRQNVEKSHRIHPIVAMQTDV